MSRLLDTEACADDFSDVDLTTDLQCFSLLENVKADNCFGLMDVDHDDIHGSLCMSRAHGGLSYSDTFYEFVRASFVLGRLGRGGGWSWGQPFWYVVRQTIELGLKLAIHNACGRWPTHHSLDVLLTDLQNEAAAHPILADVELVKFIERMHSVDPKSDGGRYYLGKDGRPSLANVCCMNTEATHYFVYALNSALEIERTSARSVV